MLVSLESRFPYALDEKCVSLTSVLTPALALVSDVNLGCASETYL